MITAKEEHTLLYDSGPEHTIILIFWTQENCDLQTASNIRLADGTFNTAPQPIAQVSIHALRGGPNPPQDGHILPYLFIQLPNNTTYTRVSESCVQQHRNKHFFKILKRPKSMPFR